MPVPSRRLAVFAGHLRAPPRSVPCLAAGAAANEWEPPLPVYAAVPRLALGSPEATAHLAEHGFVVCAGALSEAECDEVLDGMWGWLEGLGTGIDRADPVTWDDERWPPDAGVGILTNCGVTHTDWAWRVRAHPTVVRAWRSVMQEPDELARLAESGGALISSLDGLSMFRPWAAPGGKYKSNQPANQAPECSVYLLRDCLCLQPSRAGLREAGGGTWTRLPRRRSTQAASAWVAHTASTSRDL